MTITIRTGNNEIEDSIRDLKYKINTTPRFFGRFIYVKMLKKQEMLYREMRKSHLRSNLCFDHRQEQNMSHFGKGNCDRCKLEKELGR
jgi:hypothetical protein